MSPLSTKDIQDPSVRKALRSSLKGDGSLSHAEVVDLINSTLDHGAITRQECNDLQTIAGKSKTINPRTRKLLNYLTKTYRKTIGAKQKKMTIATDAANAVCDFLKRSGNGKFPMLDRDEVGVGLLMRISNPGIIHQGSSSLCGPSSLLFNVAKDKPLVYVNFAIGLFEKGHGKIGNLNIRPDADVRAYKPPMGAIDPTDWLTAASIRDSENWFFDYENSSNEFSGITMPHELATWMEKAGYQDVCNETNLLFIKGSSAIDKVNQIFQRGYRTCLFVSHNMLVTSKQTKKSTTPDHWVVLTEQIKRMKGGIKFKVFTWGKGKHEVPKGSGSLSEKHFLDNFYGYVAGKY